MMVIVSEYCIGSHVSSQKHMYRTYMYSTHSVLCLYSRVTYIDELMFGVGAGYLADVEGDVERCGNNRSDMGHFTIGLRSFEIIERTENDRELIAT